MNSIMPRSNVFVQQSGPLQPGVDISLQGKRVAMVTFSPFPAACRSI
jgi:hypothetical protein